MVALREWQYEDIDERVNKFKAAKAACPPLTLLAPGSAPGVLGPILPPT